MSVLYFKPEARKRITIPDNYGGNAFGEPPQVELHEQNDPSEPVSLNREEEIKESRLPFGIGTEELLLIGILLILSQSDEGGDILPFLLILLFLKSEK